MYTLHILLSVSLCKMLHIYRAYFIKCDSMQDVACMYRAYLTKCDSMQDVACIQAVFY